MQRRSLFLRQRIVRIRIFAGDKEEVKGVNSPSCCDFFHTFRVVIITISCVIITFIMIINIIILVSIIMIKIIFIIDFLIISFLFLLVLFNCILNAEIPV